MEVNPAFPPTDLWKLRLPLFKILNVAAKAFPFGTARNRLPEIEAVGSPPATLRKANFADADEVPPIRRSMVELPG